MTVLSRHAGSKCRYTYVAAAGSGTGQQRGFTGLAKIDLAADSPAEAVAGRVLHGAGWVGGEATFVPRTPDAADLKGALLISLEHGVSYLAGNFVAAHGGCGDSCGCATPLTRTASHKHGVPVRQHVCRTCQVRPTSRVCCPPLTLKAPHPT